MNVFPTAFSVGVFTLLATYTFTYATVGGQYSVNVHFVPPLVTSPCQIAQFWSPSNVTCALCFCMTGTLSRCIPQPGCNPNAPQNSTTTTMDPNSGNTTTSAPEPMDEDSSSSAPASPEPNPPAGSPPEMGAAAASETPVETPPAAVDPTDKPESTPGKLRAAKPGKTRRRRRRHSSQSS